MGYLRSVNPVYIVIRHYYVFFGCQLMFSLYSDVKVLCMFDDVGERHKELTYGAKQMIAKEIESEKMRIKDAAFVNQQRKSLSQKINKVIVLNIL